MFTRKTLGGNIVADASGAAFFTYESADTQAAIITDGYFLTRDASGTVTVGEGTAYKMLALDDIVMVKCVDGMFVGSISASTQTKVSLVPRTALV